MIKQLAINGGKSFFKKPLKVTWPPIDKNDIRYVLFSLKSGEHSYGPNCCLFEEEFAKWNKSKFAINTNSGTAALHMCLAATGCGTGDEIIVPAYSWSSTATVVLHHNCIPVFVDINWESSNIEPCLIESAITSKTRAIIVAHLHGMPADMNKICEIARKHRLIVIEDACQSHGAQIKGINVGNWGDCAAFSFNQNKTICAGDAGMFITNKFNCYELARRFWSFGENRKPHEKRDYHAYALGWMYRSNDLTASFGRAQLIKANEYVRWQRENAHMLTNFLQGVSSLILPTTNPQAKHSYSSYMIRINFDDTKLSVKYYSRARDLFIRALQSEGLEGVFVWQRTILPKMTVFKAKNAYGNGCPWSCPFYNNFSHIEGDYPVSQKHCDTSFFINTLLRIPPNHKIMKQIASCILKVSENIREVLSLCQL